MDAAKLPDDPDGGSPLGSGRPSPRSSPTGSPATIRPRCGTRRGTFVVEPGTETTVLDLLARGDGREILAYRPSLDAEAEPPGSAGDPRSLSVVPPQE